MVRLVIKTAANAEARNNILRIGLICMLFCVIKIPSTFYYGRLKGKIKQYAGVLESKQDLVRRTT